MIIAFVAACCFLLRNHCVCGQEWRDLQIVRERLQQKYPDREPDRSKNSLWLDAKTGLVAIEPRTMRRYLPRTRFYLTVFTTRFDEIPRVGAIVMAKGTDSGIVTYECFSPSFTRISKDFLAQFRGLHIPNEDERMRLLSEFRQLLERISNERLDVYRIGKNRYRIDGAGLEIVFDTGGRLESIVQLNPETGSEF
jgi:hypothetical protein